MSSSVVIVSYRPGDWLEACIASVIDQADQVIVVDNGSAGETASGLAKKFGADVVRARSNRGFAGGFNLGLRAVRGDVVAVLNDDAVADPSWLARATEPLEDRTVAAVTPKVLLAGWWGEVLIDDATWTAPGDARRLGRRVTSITVNGADVLERSFGAGLHPLEGAGAGGVVLPVRWRWTAGRVPFYVPLGHDGDVEVRINRDRVDVVNVVRLINHAGSALRGDGAASEIGLGAPDDGRFDERADRFAFSGTAPVWRTETLHRLGSLATPFFAYNEDTDWCFRAQLAGMRIVYEPSAVVRHRLSATSGGGNEPLVRFLAERNAVLSLVRNAPRAVAQAAVRSKFEPGANERVRRSVRRRLPWAVASRLRLRRLWTTSPAAVWARWAEEGLVWPTAPADMAWIAGHAAPGDRYRAS